MFDSGFPPLSPANFFEMRSLIHKINHSKWREEIQLKKYHLPDTSWLLNEGTNVHDRMTFNAGWSEEGLYFFAHIEGKFDQSMYPNVSEGDCLELFLDTRDRKDSGFNTKFCHHFYFLPEAIEGHRKGEITRFRTEDAHPLCEPEEVYLESSVGTKSTKLKIFLPSAILVGWNPLEFKRLGFTYRLNRRSGEEEHFSVKTAEFAVEQEPSLWASCELGAK